MPRRRPSGWRLAPAFAVAFAAAVPAEPPFDDAVALWHMTSKSGAAGTRRAPRAHGAVELGIRLDGAEREASLRRGGDGVVAQFDGGWLDAGSGSSGEPGCSGEALTVAIRLRDPSGAWSCPLLGKGSGPTVESFNIHSYPGDGGPVLAAEIGSDEVAGMHRVEARIPEIGATGWHDVVLRFDGKSVQLFVDGNLRDDEVAVGTVRPAAGERVLIGADPYGPSGKESAPEEPGEATAAPRRPDVVFEDFEAGTYGRWTVEGDAFGKRPSKAGEIFHHQTMKGWEGNYLADSFLDSADRAMGKLVSVPFTIERRCVIFLISGGKHRGRTCINLLVDGKVARTETGDDSEVLSSRHWDVKELEGKLARLEIVDAESGGWGHVMVDRIVFTDDEVKTGFRGLVDHAALWRRALTDAEIARISGVAALGDARPRYYDEKYRPQFHFTAKKHWINDPNGLFYHRGVYHLCFQHMPPGRPGAYKDWGHAVSPDLVRWKQLSSALVPHRKWGGCWSGSAVVDAENTSGFGKGGEVPIIAILTNGGTPGHGPPCTQCIAWSVDGGATFTYHEGNPVLGHIVGDNRDPKVIWHPPTRAWIMALYLDGSDYGLFASPDLKRWERLCTVTLPEVSECPDLFPLPVDGDRTNVKWVFWGANGNHVLGSFDGRTFKKESDVLRADHGANFYAAQTWSEIPAGDSRRIQIAWMAGGNYPGMPFTQQLSFPTEVTLRTTEEGIRMHRVPVREIRSLYRDERTWGRSVLEPGKDPLAGIEAELADIRAEIEPGASSAFGIQVRGVAIRYDVHGRTLSCLGRSAPLAPEEGRIELRVLLDRTSIEVFANRGCIVMTSCFLPDENKRGLALFAEGGCATLVAAEVHPLDSIWK